MFASLAGVFACTTPHQVSLQSATPRAARFPSALGCTLDVRPLVDERPLFERKGTRGEFVRLTSLVPLLFYTDWQAAGPRYVPPRQVTRELGAHLSRQLESTLHDAGVCRGPGPAFGIQPRVTHGYSVSWIRDGFTLLVVPIADDVDVSLWMSHREDMWPTAHLSLTLDVFEGERFIGSETIDERYLFEPGDHLTLWEQVAGAEPAVTVALDQALATVVTRALARAPHAVDRILSGRMPRPRRTERFVLLRLTDEVEFVERIEVDTATGRILSNDVRRRVLPIMSRPGEWIVAPLGADGRFLDASSYDALLRTMSDYGYQVAWGSNLSAARFVGGGPAPGELPLAIPAPAEGP